MFFYFENRNKAVSVSQLTGLWPHPHLHTEIEMVFLLSGETLATADSKSAVLKEGDVYIAFPNQIHSYNDRITPKHLLIIFSPELVGEFKGIFDNNIPASPVIENALANPHLKWTVDRILKISQEHPPYADEHLRGLLLVMLSELFNMMSFEAAPKYDSNILKQVIKYCTENYTQDITLSSIADDLHVSKYYLSHLFGKKLKVSFNDYINTMRIKRACELLNKKEGSVIDIGYAVGYNSTRSFNRCFKSVCGVTPKEYRAGRRDS